MKHKTNLFWICPNCETLNEWKQSACKKCLKWFDKEVAHAAFSNEEMKSYKDVKLVTVARNTFAFTANSRRK